MEYQVTDQANALMATLYTELRKLAHARMRGLPPGQTLQPTGLVHEAYLRLMKNQEHLWDGRHHFFGAAAMAMRDILVERARYKAARKHGGAHVREDLTYSLIAGESPLSGAELMALHGVLDRMQALYPEYAEVVLMHCFAGMTMKEVAEVVGVSQRTIERRWRFARALLAEQLKGAKQRKYKKDPKHMNKPYKQTAIQVDQGPCETRGPGRKGKLR